ncbi:SPOR domain-containing protein [Rhodoferax saidenbachensis]|uniref:SPOR domain-containing protein n=2 Tax=Rhodoferax saidenbachensis TaxID=1484693 RepID=A0A1P8KBI1_9BURK|nr:SPOR domain-containing protein [Rhodoferax saidenbachensis]APW43361.1 SPOR domain-containing protein [Rhodoferax saidenbachensis]
MATAPSSAATTLDRSDEGATAALYRAAIGPVNADYYAPRFAQFEAADHAGASWNSAACLCTLNWMVFRQLWSAALVYVGALVGGALLVFGIGRLVLQFSQETEWGLLAGFVAAAFLLPGLYGNAIFHAQTRKRMAAALAANTTLPEAVSMLSRQASTRRRFIWLALANLAVVGAAAAAYTLLPNVANLGIVPDQPADARNVAVGRTTDAASGPALAASAAAPAASAPVAAASAPVAAASAVTTGPASAPAAAAAALQAASAPLVVASAPLAAKAATPAITPPAKPVASAPRVTTTPAPTPSAAAAKPAKAQPAPATATVAPKKPLAAQRYFINVGLFAEETNARNAHTKLLDAGLVAFTEEMKTPKGKRIRVRVGPFEAIGDADAAAERIRGLGLDAELFQR